MNYARARFASGCKHVLSCNHSNIVCLYKCIKNKLLAYDPSPFSISHT